jgi:flavin reductase (DIM6/NTAB) family NADH-FMN oxidoreductase RutF
LYRIQIGKLDREHNLPKVKTNLAVFSSITHLGSNPPLIGFVLRPTTVPRDSYRNIKASSLFTVNHIHHDTVADAHHTSAKYPRRRFGV